MKCSEILNLDLQDEVANLGIGLFEVFNGFAERELKYMRHHPIPFCLPAPSAGNRMFFASIFGVLPPPILAEFKRALPEFPGLQIIGCSGNEYLGRLERGTLSFRRMGVWGFEASRNRHNQADCVLYMDGSHPGDVIAFWNLRALGWNVAPVCRRTAADPSIRKEVESFIDRNFFPLRDNPSIYNQPLLLPSRPELISEATGFMQQLALKQAPGANEHPWALCPHYPRIWDAWAREKDGGVPCRLEAEESETPIKDGEDRARFPALVPEFASKFGGGRDGRRCANEVEMRVWGHERPYAEVIPEGGDELVRVVADHGLREWRCGGSGPVYYPRHKNWHETIPLAVAEPIFTAWLKERGWSAELSAPGHIASQMFRQLGGIHGASFLAIDGMVEILGRLAKAGTVNSKQFFGELTRLSQLPSNRLASASRLAQRLVAHQIVQLGVEVQCPHCRQRSWYSVPEARYDLKCTKCLTDFSLPSHSPREIVWSYRATGAFSLPSSGQHRLRDQTYGSPAVLLAMRFFAQALHGSTTPLFSFIAKKGTTEIEADLGLFFLESKFKDCRIEQLFCECKTFNAFEAKDARRMAVLGSEFPGAFLVFVTLKKSLSAKERRILIPIVNRGRRYWKHERPFNPVLILTGNELFSDHGVEGAWRAIGGIHAQRAQTLRYENRLLELAGATQEIYLGMQPWHIWLRQRISRKEKRKGTVSPLPAETPTGGGASDSPVAQQRGFPVRLRQVPFM